MKKLASRLVEAQGNTTVLSPTMTSTSPSHILVTHTYGENRIPSHAEVIVVRFSHWETLFGPGSTLGSGRDLPSRATRHNYHHAVVIDGSLDMCQPILTLTVLPVAAYSAIDPIFWIVLYEMATWPTRRLSKSAHPGAI